MVGKIKAFGTGAAGLLMLGVAAQPAAAASAAAASVCASAPAGSNVTVYSASDSGPAAVTTRGGSTTVSITFTAMTYFDYLYPVFSVDSRNGNDGAEPSYAPPAFEYSVNGGSWSSTATHFDTSGSFGGDVWAAYLPEWTDRADGTVTTLRVKVVFSGSMPSGTYDDWFGMQGTEVCGVENLSPPSTRLSALTYAPPAAVATKQPSNPPTSSGGSQSVPATGATGGASAASSSSRPAAAVHPASSGSTTPIPSQSTAIESVASAAPSGTTLTDAQNAADRSSSSSSGSSTLLWVIIGALVLFAGVGGTMAMLRRRSRA